MYVKVTAGHAPGIPKGDFLCRVTPPIHFDYISAKLGPNAKWEPSQSGDDSTQLVSPDINWEDALGASIDFIHVLEISANRRTNYERTKDLLSFRYVWWHDPDTGLTAVVTTRNIFILGENGKTIDKVG